MTPEPLVIGGVGSISAVGLTAPETVASVRSATMRFSEIDFLDHSLKPFTVAEIPRELLPELLERVDIAGVTSREDRMLRLAGSALDECLSSLPAGEPPPLLMLSLPECRTTIDIDEQRLLNRLAAQTGRDFDVAGSDASYRGRAGGLQAFAAAMESVHSGRTSLALVGGIDTYIDPYILATLDLDKRVKSDAHLDGFIPGEGAAFVLLAKAGAGALPALASVSKVAVGFEPGHIHSEDTYQGEGLAQTFQQLAEAEAASSPVETVLSSMNGEGYWAKEWGVARVRHDAMFHAEHDMYHPADCTGDLGAACGPMLLGLAALGIRQGYYRCPVLVYASSDYGSRAALILDAPKG